MWSYPPRSILVPVDFGRASERALTIASTIAGRHGSAVVGLHAETIDVPPYFTHDQLAEVERQRSSVRVMAEQYLQDFVCRHAPAATSLLTDGPAVEAVLAAAVRHDLVVMGTHGRRGPSRWWMGSVAERVVRDAPVPVMVVREADAHADPRPVFARLVAVAGPAFGGEALRYASGLAEAFGGSVDQDPVASIERLTCSPSATMMVVTVGKHHGQAWFGDTAERLVRNCPLPMLFVPAQG